MNDFYEQTARSPLQQPEIWSQPSRKVNEIRIAFSVDYSSEIQLILDRTMAWSWRETSTHIEVVIRRTLDSREEEMSEKEFLRLGK